MVGVLHVYLGSGKHRRSKFRAWEQRVRRADMALMNQRAKWMLRARIARLGCTLHRRVYWHVPRALEVNTPRQRQRYVRCASLGASALLRRPQCAKNVPRVSTRAIATQLAASAKLVASDNMARPGKPAERQPRVAHVHLARTITRRAKCFA